MRQLGRGMILGAIISAVQFFALLTFGLIVYYDVDKPPIWFTHGLAGSFGLMVVLALLDVICEMVAL